MISRVYSRYRSKVNAAWRSDKQPKRFRRPHRVSVTESCSSLVPEFERTRNPTTSHDRHYVRTATLVDPRVTAPASLKRTKIRFVVSDGSSDSNCYRPADRCRIAEAKIVKHFVPGPIFQFFLQRDSRPVRCEPLIFPVFHTYLKVHEILGISGHDHCP